MWLWSQERQYLFLILDGLNADWIFGYSVFWKVNFIASWRTNQQTIPAPWVFTRAEQTTWWQPALSTHIGSVGGMVRALNRPYTKGFPNNCLQTILLSCQHSQFLRTGNTLWLIHMKLNINGKPHIYPVSIVSIIQIVHQVKTRVWRLKMVWS